MPLLLVLLLFLVACSDVEEATDRELDWVVGPDPTLQIGVMDGDPDQEFSRIMAVLELDDGRIVVADGQAPDGALRLFSANGDFLDRTLPAGEGPREVQMAGWVGFVQGGIGVWDRGAQRILVVDVNDEGFVWRDSRALDLSHPDPPDSDPDTQMWFSMAPSLVGVLFDGSFIGLPSQNGGGSWGQRVRLERDLMRWGPDGTSPEVIRTVPAQEIILPDPTAGQQSMPPVPFPIRLAVAVDGDRILHGIDAPGHVIEVLDPDGAVRETLEWDGGSRSVTPELQRAWLDQEEVDEAVFPDAHAPFRSLMVADDGHIWVRGEVLPGRDEFWFVLDPEGEYLGRVASPGRFVAHRISSGEMLGVYTDEFDVQYVRRYPIQ